MTTENLCTSTISTQPNELQAQILKTLTDSQYRKTTPSIPISLNPIQMTFYFGRSPPIISTSNPITPTKGFSSADLCYKWITHKGENFMGRPKQNRKIINVRVDWQTPSKMRDIALSLGYLYNGAGHTGGLLDAIAQGDIILLKRT